MSGGIFGDLFDFNHDGNVDWMERAAEMACFFGAVESGNEEDPLAAAGLDRDE